MLSVLVVTPFLAAVSQKDWERVKDMQQEKKSLERGSVFIEVALLVSLVALIAVASGRYLGNRVACNVANEGIVLAGGNTGGFTTEGGRPVCAIVRHWENRRQFTSVLFARSLTFLEISTGTSRLIPGEVTLHAGDSGRGFHAMSDLPLEGLLSGYSADSRGAPGPEELSQDIQGILRRAMFYPEQFAASV